MEQQIEIELNGAPHQLRQGQNLEELIGALELSNQALAVAVNRQIVPRHGWSERILQPRDRVDVVRAIGGG